jgi:hypothetical protein
MAGIAMSDSSQFLATLADATNRAFKVHMNAFQYSGGNST